MSQVTIAGTAKPGLTLPLAAAQVPATAVPAHDFRESMRNNGAVEQGLPAAAPVATCSVAPKAEQDLIRGPFVAVEATQTSLAEEARVSQSESARAARALTTEVPEGQLPSSGKAPAGVLRRSGSAVAQHPAPVPGERTAAPAHAGAAPAGAGPRPTNIAATPASKEGTASPLPSQPLPGVTSAERVVGPFTLPSSVLAEAAAPTAVAAGSKQQFPPAQPATDGSFPTASLDEVSPATPNPRTARRMAGAEPRAGNHHLPGGQPALAPPIVSPAPHPIEGARLAAPSEVEVLGGQQDPAASPLGFAIASSPQVLAASGPAQGPLPNATLYSPSAPAIAAPLLSLTTAAALEPAAPQSVNDTENPIQRQFPAMLAASTIAGAPVPALETLPPSAGKLTSGTGLAGKAAAGKKLPPTPATPAQAAATDSRPAPADKTVPGAAAPVPAATRPEEHPAAATLVPSASATTATAQTIATPAALAPATPAATVHAAAAVPQEALPAAQPSDVRTLTATPQVLEIGVENGTHGWLRVRAEMSAGGEVAASVVAPTATAAQALHRDMPALHEYLASEQVSVASVAVATATGQAAAGAGSQRGERQPSAPQDQPRQATNSAEPWSIPSANTWLGLAETPSMLSQSGGGGWVNIRV